MSLPTLSLIPIVLEVGITQQSVGSLILKIQCAILESSRMLVKYSDSWEPPP